MVIIIVGVVVAAIVVAAIIVTKKWGSISKPNDSVGGSGAKRQKQ